jgi:hypothetical protein
MSQHDFNIANQTFPSFRADLNDALVAAATMSAGSSAPTTPYAYQLWFDTTTGTWKVRNSGNTAWISTITTDLATGNVGIGISPDTSPSTKLHIREDDAVDYKSRAVVQATDQRLVAGSHYQLGVAAYSYLQATNDAETLPNNLLLNPDGGNVGIGGSPTENFEVFAATTNGTAKIGQLMFKNSSGNYATSTDGVHIFPFSDGNTYINNFDGGFVFRTGASVEKMRILPTGGITFNGDTSTNNALDDYEEGTWTAAFAASTTNATGYYTKVGNTVFFTVYGNGLNVTSTGTSAAINGLPFTNNGGYTVATITHDTYTNNSYNGYVQSGGTSIHPIQDGTVSSAGTVAGTPKYIMVSGTYITNA